MKVFEKRDAYQYNEIVLNPAKKGTNSKVEEAPLYEKYTKREDFANQRFDPGDWY